MTNLQKEIPAIILLIFETLKIQSQMNLALPRDELTSENIVWERKPQTEWERSWEAECALCMPGLCVPCTGHKQAPDNTPTPSSENLTLAEEAI